MHWLVCRLDKEGQRIRKPNGKYVVDAVPTTDWGRPETLDRWRADWADLANQLLRQNAEHEKIGKFASIERKWGFLTAWCKGAMNPLHLYCSIAEFSEVFSGCPPRFRFLSDAAVLPVFLW